MANKDEIELRLTIDGPHCSGKSTVLRAVMFYLRARGIICKPGVEEHTLILQFQRDGRAVLLQALTAHARAQLAASIGAPEEGDF